MRFGEAFIDLYRFQRCGLGPWQRFVWRYGAASIRRAHQIVCVGESTVSQREHWIFFYRLLKVFERLLQPFFASLVIVKPSFQIKLISLVAFGVVLGKPTLLARHFEF